MFVCANNALAEKEVVRTIAFAVAALKNLE